jgi:polyisoprenoid-binding protein YceI
MSWNIDSAHSEVEFTVKHLMVATVKGRFQKVSGTAEFDETNPAASHVEATIDATSIDTHEANRDGHLRAPDFFDTEKYPTLTFKSTKVEKANDNEYKVTGDLTIKGVTKSVTLDVEYAGQTQNPFSKNTHAGFTAKTSINRKDFGLNWNVALETGGFMVSDKVNINLEIELVAVAAEAPATA